jgi:hypothetical protein
MTSQGLMPARNSGLISHRPGKLNNSKWPLSKFSRAMATKTSIPRGHLLFTEKNPLQVAVKAMLHHEAIFVATWNAISDTEPCHP